MSPTKQDTCVSVVVRRLLPFGLLVGLDDGRYAIVREREIAWERDARRHWREHFAPGDTLPAVVLGDGHEPRPELSLRLAQHNPWSDLAVRHEVGQIVEGVVTGIQPYSVFVEIEPAIDGLLHRSRLPEWVSDRDVMGMFWPGDRIRVAIEAIDTERRRLSLNLARATLSRWQSAEPLSMPPRPG